jgi:hypothetical protein
MSNQANQTNYESVYKNVGQVRRTLARPEDAVAIHKHTTENERAVAIIKDFVMVMCVFGAVALVVTGMFLW